MNTLITYKYFPRSGSHGEDYFVTDVPLTVQDIKRIVEDLGVAHKGLVIITGIYQWS